MSEPASTHDLLVAARYVAGALAGDGAALSEMGRSFQKTVAQVENSIALLTESAAILEREVNFDYIARRMRRMAERHVAQGEQCIRRQRELVAKLERHGHDARDAKRLLSQFEELHALQVAHFNRLQAEQTLTGRSNRAANGPRRVDGTLGLSFPGL